MAGMSPAGTPRDEASTFWAVDVIFHPIDNWPVIMDWNNHRIITIDEDDAVKVLSGVGGQLGSFGKGPRPQ